jgi:hypothetical protein
MLLPFTDSLVQASRFDPELCRLADQHYSRQKPGTPQFCPPGELILLRNCEGSVVFSWVNQKYRNDLQRGYYNSIFRNESERLSSAIILEAERFAIQRWGGGRAFTKADPLKIKSLNPGYCFKQAGWQFCGIDPDGKHILEKFLYYENR